MKRQPMRPRRKPRVHQFIGRASNHPHFDTFADQLAAELEVVDTRVPLARIPSDPARRSKKWHRDAEAFMIHREADIKKQLHEIMRRINGIAGMPRHQRRTKAALLVRCEEALGICQATAALAFEEFRCVCEKSTAL